MLKAYKKTVLIKIPFAEICETETLKVNLNHYILYII
jgi:hypothetical protein